MNENEILLGFKNGKYTMEEVLEFYQKLKNNEIRYPLSEGQKGLWMLNKLDPTSNVYNIPICFRIRANVDIEKLKQAFGLVVTRHDQLSCVIIEDGGVPYLAPQPFNPETFSSIENEVPDEEELLSLLKEEAKKLFDLARDPFIRMNIYSISPIEHIALIVVHHLVFDGASTPVFLADLLSFYEAAVNCRDAEVSEEVIMYDQFVEWEQDYLFGTKSKTDREYWLSKLEGELPTLLLDIEQQNETCVSAQGTTLATQLTGSKCTAVSEFCTELRVKPTAFFLSIFQILLQRYTGENDLIIGIPTMGRPKLEFYDVVGYFINMIPLRSMVNEDRFYSDYLTELNYAIAEGMDHSMYPFPRIVQDLNIQRNIQTPPVFQVTYTFQNKNLFKISANSPTLGEVEYVEKLSQEGEFKLSLEVYEKQDRFVVCFKYDANKFDEKDIASMMNHYNNLLTAVMRNPRAPIGSYCYLSEKERNQVLIDWNRTKAPYPEERCLHEIFEAQVNAHPDSVALEFEGLKLSYKQLNERANQVAAYLRQSGVRTETVVALCAERSFEMVIGILGIVKAGGAYLPIDPAYPAERINYMLENAGVNRMLTLSYLADALPTENMNVAFLDTGEDLGGEAVFANQPTTNLTHSESGVETSNLAYVMYTSGSTGLPKAVMVEHRALTNRIDWMQKEYKLSTYDVVLQKTPFSFDVSVWEFFWPLITGARMVIAKPGGHADPEYLTSLIQSSGVTTLHFVPSMFRIILGQEAWSLCRTIRHVFCSGEALAPDLVTKHYAQNHAPLINLYGPTEAAIDVSYWACSNNNEINAVPIGKPIQNVQLYVLNNHCSPQAVGCRGQLYIGGDCLARGYLNNPELTAEKFIANPFSNDKNARLYKTGDIVRWLQDGSLEYCGRSDDQVKIRGVRIELGEIEAKLNSVKEVDSSLVIVREDNPGDQRIVAYVVLSDGAQDTDVGGTLTKVLKETLPDHMIPSAYVVLDEIPVTANGKANRSKLPAPEWDAYTSQVYVAPRTETETLLVDIWTEILGFEAGQIGVNDNFFALGGHSLLIPKLLARLQQYELMADIRSVFEAPTLAHLASEIQDAATLEAYMIPPNKIPEGCKHITADMLTLVSLSDEEIDSIVSDTQGGSANIQDIYPLAPLQEGILFHHLMDVENDPYVLSGLFSFDNRERLDQFVFALQNVINRNDVLRTAIVSKGVSQPVQVVWRRAELVLEIIQPTPGVDAQQYIRSMLSGPHVMDISVAPMMQLKAVCDSETGVWYLLFNMHHLVDDATSLGFLFAEVVAYLKGKEASLSTPIPYREFIAHTMKQVNSLEAKAFFERTLGDLNEPTLPYGLANVHVDRNIINVFSKSFPADLSSNIRAFAKRMHLSPASIFHAAWAMVISTCSGKEDVVFGTVLSGRLQGVQGAERMLGNFINTLPLRVSLANKSVKQLLQETDVILRNLIKYEQASLSLAQSCSSLDNDIPLFNAVLNFRFMNASERINEDELAQFGIKSLVGVFERTNYPLFLSIDDQGVDFSVEIQAVQSLSCESIHSYLENAVSEIINAMLKEAAVGTLVSTISILPQPELEQVVEVWNTTERDYPNDMCIHQVFRRRAQENSERIAILYGDNSVTYGELDQMSTDLANDLSQSGAAMNKFVAVVADRSIEMIVGLLGVMKAGAAYIPIDPEIPEERLAHILTDSKAGIVLTHDKYKERISNVLNNLLHENGVTDRPLIIDLKDTVSREKSEHGHLYNDENSMAITNDSLAYVIYTSGTTGNSKGVCVTHKSIMNTLYFLEEMYPVEENDYYILKTNYTFDVSISELFGWFVGKGHLVILPPGDEKSPYELIRHIENYRVTHINFVPSMLREFLQSAQGNKSFLENCSIKYLMVAGEAFPKELVEQTTTTFKNVKVENIYGPTEAAIYATVHSCSNRERTGMITPIGKPIGNVQVYIVDSNCKPTPIGVPGELCISGAGLAQGYLNNDQLTKEKFIDNPFQFGTKLYKTGDLARWSPDGHIEYLGRLDFQVKIRGYRIELGEIEHHLNQHPAVRDAVVVKRELIRGEDTLVAYPAIDRKSASACYNILTMLEEGTLAQDDLYELDNGMEVCGLNKYEIDMLYRDNFLNMLPDVSLKEGDCVFNVGANIGMSSLSLLSKVEGLRIYSFEPIYPVYEILCKNSRIDGSNSIIPVHAGLSNSVRETQFDYYPDLSLISGEYKDSDTSDIIRCQRYLTDAGKIDGKALSYTHTGKILESQHVNVSLTTISEQIRILGLTSIALVKIDINNSGLKILEGIDAEDWEKIDQFVITVSPVLSEIDKLKECLSAQGFKHVVSYSPEGNEGGNYNLIAKRDVTGSKSNNSQSNNIDLKCIGTKKVKDLLITHLESNLPDYMIPTRIVLMNKLPLSQAGKIDYKSLPMPRRISTSEEYNGPHNQVEELLISIWAELFDIEVGRISVNESFFSYGGHSLLVMRMLNRIKQKTGVELPIKNIFKNPTVSAIAVELNQFMPEVSDNASQITEKILQGIEMIEGLTEEELSKLLG
ncbi:amino acid adenylation domain-containing protein [Brevibacillus laterosporus]|uniref:non-ribosomal peptide synthetase n=1 Tax=Brevibacillus laterosporus TaxID=1465 RepID=UPI00215D24D1|nr:non-ribosomal peptide synthetase [Brevibacillus laterosporus]MCR8936092.1 amino acid adenylation domain-containing protein [Brevibacillus laterosporus]MCZ0838731.1 amino acid adenylation domain-containing protein [Brevibacillus laterosporus]MCZ0845259.1 amino acid adenylation domain-containing protein [Brevibacillus laterosporus]